MTLQTSLNRRFLRFRMSAQEADVLLRCVEAGQINPGQLAVLLGKDKGKITRFVDRLETRKLVTQKINLRDRRYFVIKPTGKGKKAARELACLFESVRKELFSGLGEDELSQFSEMLALVRANAAAISCRHAEEVGLSEESCGIDDQATTQVKERSSERDPGQQLGAKDHARLDLN